MLESREVSCSALSDSRFRPSFVLLLGCALFACTEQQIDDGPALLSRTVPTTSEPSALAFDGLAAYATTGTAQFPSGQKEQTLSAWFQVDNLSGKHALITLRKDRDSGIELGLKDGLLGAWRVHSNRLLVSATTPITSGAWHHAAYSFDKFTNQLYIDGVLVGSSTISPDERTPTTCWLGTLDGTNDLFQGQIDDVRVFASTRSRAQIAAEAAGTRSSTDPTLVLDLPCNEPAGDIIFDHSPSANDGQLGDGIESHMPTRVQPGVAGDSN